MSDGFHLSRAGDLRPGLHRERIYFVVAEDQPGHTARNQRQHQADAGQYEYAVAAPIGGRPDSGLDHGHTQRVSYARPSARPDLDLLDALTLRGARSAA